MDNRELRHSDASARVIDTPFGRFAALEWGDASAPALLALHGWLDNAASFHALAPRLARSHRVIALDLAGHGHSDHLPAELPRYHLVDQIDHVAAVLDALDLARVDLVGHSLGAAVAALLAAALPERVRAMVLIDGLGPLADQADETLTRFRAAWHPAERGTRAPRVFSSVDEAVAARIAVDGLAADEVRPIVRRNLIEAHGGFAWRSDRRLRRATPWRIDEAQLARILAAIDAPTRLLLADPETPYLPRPMMEARAAQLRRVAIERMGGPHHLHLRHPERVASAAQDWFASCAT